MRDEISIDIGKDFSRYPAGRTTAYGPYSGEAFREKFLRSPIAKGQHVVVLMDSAVGYGSSFLDEAFAGLVRVGVASATRLRELLTLRSEDDSLIDEVWTYVDDEEKRRQRAH